MRPVAVSASRYFVVGEKSQQGAPKAYIYQYPSLAIEQTLEHGTEQAYSAAAFNQAGDRLATVGSYPDFMLTVWDWRSGCTLLRSKAFSQEVYCVSFCPYADGSLVTSGMAKMPVHQTALAQLCKLSLRVYVTVCNNVCLFVHNRQIVLLAKGVPAVQHAAQIVQEPGEILHASRPRHNGLECDAQHVHGGF